jgi:peptidoglycan/xylan/chitin deacetylase (PgdA/CDA1 family)
MTPSDPLAVTRAVAGRIARKLSDAAARRIVLNGARGELQRGVLSVAFDDFPKTAWEAGGPLLRELGVKATYYVSGSLCGRRHEGLQAYDEDDLEAAREAGHEIGCHTYGHLHAASHAVEEYLSSIDRNAAFLAERVPGWRAGSFAYPYGSAPSRFRRALASRFGACRSTVAGINHRRVDLSLLRAVGLERCRGSRVDVPRLIEMAARERAWLIIYTHDVCEHHSDYGCSPAELERTIRMAVAAGLDVQPVGAVAAACFPPAAARLRAGSASARMDSGER